MGSEYKRRDRICVHIFSYVKNDTGSPNKNTDCNAADVDAVEVEKFFKDRLKLQDEDIVYPKEYLGVEMTYNRYDCFFFIFLTCIRDSQIHISDDKTLSLNEILDKAKNEKSMAGKPKVFLVQADDLEMWKPLYTGEAEKGNRKLVKTKLPQDADRLVIMSTIPQAMAVHPTVGGTMSFLVKAFIDKMSIENEQDLLSKTVEINAQVYESIQSALEKDAKAEKGKAVQPGTKKLSEMFKTEELVASPLKVPLVISTFTKFLKF